MSGPLGAATVPPSRDGESGFVLIAALWFVALLALVAVIIAGWMSRAIDRTVALQDQIAARAEEISLVNRVAYLMTGSYFSTRGLEVLAAPALARAATQLLEPVAPVAGAPYIALDNRPYRFGTLVVRLQDERGLYSLEAPGRASLDNLLRLYGVAPGERDALIDKLLDYIDKSEFTRLSGASRQDYIRAGRAPPRATLATPWEAYRVLGWDQYRGLWQGPQALPTIASVGEASGLNPNTAPEPVLSTVPGFNSRAIDRLVQFRRHHPIESWFDLERATGVALSFDPVQFLFFPSGSLRVTMLAAHDPLMRTIELRLTPAAKAPYRVDYAVGSAPMPDDDTLIDDRELPLLPGPSDAP